MTKTSNQIMYELFASYVHVVHKMYSYSCTLTLKDRKGFSYYIRMRLADCSAKESINCLHRHDNGSAFMDMPSICAVGCRKHYGFSCHTVQHRLIVSGSTVAQGWLYRVSLPELVAWIDCQCTS